jgi:hypothetical protein
LHPSENFEDYQIWLQNKNVYILRDKNLQHWAFKVSKAVLTFNSAFAIDALLKGKLVIHMKVSDSIQTALNQLIEDDIIPVCQNEMVLTELILGIESESVQKEFNEKMQNFKAYYCQHYGREAAQKYSSFLN